MIEAGIPRQDMHHALRPSKTRRAGRFVRATATFAVLAAVGGCADARADVSQIDHASTLSTSNTKEGCPPKKIVILGSSPAAGAGAEPASNGWAYRYEEHLKSLHPDNEVINLAVSGSTTYRALPNGSKAREGRPAPDPHHNISAALSHEPDEVIVAYSANDLMNKFTLEETDNNLQKIQETARRGTKKRSNIPVLVATPVPRNLSEPKRRTLRDLSTRIQNKYSRVIDFWSPLANADGTIKKEFDADGIHPNNEGHRLLFEKVVASDINSMLCKASPIR